MLAIHGEQDEYGSAAHPARIGELVGGPSRVVVLPGAGHFFHGQLALLRNVVVQQLQRPRA